MIAAAEIALLNRLKAASDAGHLGYRWRTLETYPANWDAYLSQKTIVAPAAWVVFAGFRQGEPVGFGGLLARAQFGVVVMAENARNETATRHGGPSAAEPGSYQLALDAIGLLQGQDLGVFASAIEITALHPMRTEALLRERKASMWAIELEAALVVRGADGDWAPAPAGTPLGLGDFATFHVDWDAPPHGAIPPTLPDDAHADAVDHVTMETRNG